ncbi:MAG TPA: MFS transporter [Gemmatimonadaceae bacterium]|nr:MFS transporter [Gemmatimonadaceae bacterium]
MTSPTPTPPTRATPHYAWVVVGITFVILLVSAGVRAVPAVLMLPLEQEFGWLRTTTSAALSVNILLYGLTGPFAGSLMARVGVRRVVLVALGLLASGVAIAPFIRERWQLVALWGLGIGVGTGLVAVVLAATVVNRWFVARRGMVLGVLTASASTGQLLFLPMLARATERYGWRVAVLVVAAIVAALIPLTAWLLRERPESVGLRPYGADTEPVSPDRGPAERAEPLGALAVLRHAATTRNFWVLCISFFVCGASTNGLIGAHLIPAAHDHGIPEVRAASLLALMGLCDLVGTTAAGWMSDRWDSRWLLAGYYGLRGLSLLFLPTALAGADPALILFAVWYGLDWIATVPPTLRLANDAFGRTRAPIVFGWIAGGHQLGAASIALAAGALRVSSGRYDWAFLGAGALCIGAAALSLAFRHGPAEERPTALPLPTPLRPDAATHPAATAAVGGGRLAGLRARAVG